MLRHGLFELQLAGGFRLAAPDGRRLRVASRKGMALIGMLALARDGERSRLWLQDRLWGSRGPEQAQASLRRELANLRTVFLDAGAPDIIAADQTSVSLDLDRFRVDLRDARVAASLSAQWGELLEGFDIAEEGFEDWLREQRARLGTGPRDDRAPPGSPDDTNRTADLLGGKPTIAVIVGPDALETANQVRLEGVAETLSDRLSRLRWMAVIAAPAASKPTLRPDAASRTLNVEYLLRCWLAAASGGYELQLVLAKGVDNLQLWSRRFPMERSIAADTLACVMDETVAALASRVEVDQQMRALDRGAARLRPDELVWRARWHMRRLTREDARIAAELLAEAALSNPNDVNTQIELTFLMAWRIWTTRAGVPEKEGLRAAAMRVRDLDPFDARTYFLCGVAEFWLGHHAAATALLTTAIELNPSMANAYGHLGSCRSLAGDPEAALPLLRTALRLDPLGAETFHQYGELALANYMLGRYEEAVVDATEALARRPAYAHAHAIRIAALGDMGARDEELAARRALAATKPGLGVQAVDWVPFKDPRWADRLKNALDPLALKLAG